MTRRSTTVLAGVALAACLVLPANAQTSRGTAARATAAPRTVTLTANDQMQFSVGEIEARPGERLHVVLKNIGQMPKLAMGHNFVVLKADTDAAAFATAGMSARDTDFIAPDQQDKVIAATPLSGPGETVEVTFSVPATRGRYPYLCTFPGHFAAGMGGTLVVR